VGLLCASQPGLGLYFHYSLKPEQGNPLPLKRSEIPCNLVLEGWGEDLDITNSFSSVPGLLDFSH